MPTYLRGGQKISIQQALGYANKAGFTGVAQTTIVAIAMAESGLYTDVYNGSCCYGLVQINRNHFGEQYRALSDGQLHTMSLNDALDPQRSMDFARYLSGFGIDPQPIWTPWETYTNGAYKQYMSAVQAAGGSTTPNQPADIGASGGTTANSPSYLDQIGQVASEVSGIVNVINKLSDPKVWAAVGVGTIGVVLVIVGFIALSAPFVEKEAEKEL